MFDAERVPMRIAKIAPRQLIKDDLEIQLVELTLEINPLRVELANELDGFVRTTLFSRSDVEVNAKLGAATFRLPVPPQTIVVRAAPDQPEGSFTIDEAKIGPFKAKRSKKTSTWRLEFTATCAWSSEHLLAQLMECHLKMRYCTFAPAIPGLFDEIDREERRQRAKDLPSRRGGAPDHVHTH